MAETNRERACEKCGGTGRVPERPWSARRSGRNASVRASPYAMRPGS